MDRLVCRKEQDLRHGHFLEVNPNRERHARYMWQVNRMHSKRLPRALAKGSS